MKIILIYLLLLNKVFQNVEAENTQLLLSHDFCESEAQARFGWVPLARALPAESLFPSAE